MRAKNERREGEIGQLSMCCFSSGVPFCQSWTFGSHRLTRQSVLVMISTESAHAHQRGELVAAAGLSIAIYAHAATSTGGAAPGMAILPALGCGGRSAPYPQPSLCDTGKDSKTTRANSSWASAGSLRMMLPISCALDSSGTTNTTNGNTDPCHR